MSDETKVSPTPEEAIDNTIDNESDSEDVKSLLAQKKHFRDKLEKLTIDFESYKTQNPEKVAAPISSEPKPSNNDDSRLEKIEFTLAHPDLGAEVIKEVFDLAKSKGIKTEDALKSPMAKAYIESVRAEQAVVKATPSGGRSPKIAGAKPVSEMTIDERKEHLKKLVS